MTRQPDRLRPSPASDPGAEVAQLRGVLSLAGKMAGRPAAADENSALDKAARMSAAYGDAMPIVQRRFDAAAAEAAALAAAGMKALVALQDGRRPTGPAAARFADELALALGRLGAILKR